MIYFDVEEQKHKWKKNKFEALSHLIGPNFSALGDVVEYVEGVTAPTEEEIEAEMDRLEAEFNSLAWERSRQADYDSVGNQLDMLMKDMKNNTTTHRESCEAVKAQFPKP